MKGFDPKSLIAGLLIGTLGVTTAFAAGEIKSAAYSDVKVTFYGQEVALKNQLIAVEKEGATGVQLYMPVREVLEYMKFKVDWIEKTRTINLTLKSDQ